MSPFFALRPILATTASAFVCTLGEWPMSEANHYSAAGVHFPGFWTATGISAHALWKSVGQAQRVPFFKRFSAWAFFILGLRLVVNSPCITVS